jgi:predicted MFS family arabinose efflux permease
MKKLVFLAVGMFVVGCSSFIIAGLLPEIAKTVEESLAVTGQGITAFSLAYLISAPLCSLLPGIKSEKTVVQFALTIFIVGHLITAAAENLAVFLLGRVIAGIGAGAFVPSCVTITMRFTDSAKQGRALSFILGANSAGVVFGIPLGLYLSTRFNWQASMVYIVALTFIALFGVTFQKLGLETAETKAAFFDRFRLLADRRVLSVIGVTCFTCMACIGLHSYVAPLQNGTPYSLAVILFVWGLGGFLGSSFVGYFVDLTKRPQFIMTLILTGLVLTFLALPKIKGLQYVGLLPFLFWGALGWATTTPQQHTLFGIDEEQGKLLVALNSSALGLGGALGTAACGSLIASGIEADRLPLFASGLLFAVLLFQLLFVNRIETSARPNSQQNQE